MGTIVVSLSVSVDGFFEGPDADLSWHLVDDELHAHFNEEAAKASAFLEGRVSYQLMDAFWPTADQDPDSSEPMREFSRIWRETPKVVYSRTLDRVGENATLVREVVPEEVRELAARGDLAVGGADLASSFQRLGLVDEYRLYVHPVVIGRGRPLFAPGSHLDLRLEETRAFGNGVVLLRYSVTGAS
jgi:dihydrofolate reductase